MSDLIGSKNHEHGGVLVIALLCALTLVAQTELFGPAEIAVAERELYTAAHRAISDKDVPAAIGFLEQLTEAYPNSPLTPVAIFHLAECYLIENRPWQALETITDWVPVLQTEQPNPVGATSVMRQLEDLLPRVLRGLPEASVQGKASLANRESAETAHDPLEHLASLLEGSAKPELPSEFKRQIAMELSRRYKAMDDFYAAETWLLRAINCEGAASELSTRLRFDLLIAQAQRALARGDAADAVQILSPAVRDELTAEQSIALRFLLAEALLADNQRRRAAEELEWLATQVPVAGLGEDWRASIALRQSELLVAERKYELAATLLEEARSRYPAFPASSEFDYLLARCAIARIDFEAAENLLKQVLHSQQARGKEIGARATWLLGEVYFLQHRFEDAANAYRQTSQMAEYPQWQARGWLQLAKCHELGGRSEAALSAYQRAVETDNDRRVQDEAQRRIAVLRTAANNQR